MMEVFAVFVKHTTTLRQYIDSLWVRRFFGPLNGGCAESRANELNSIFKAMDVDFAARVVSMKLQDAIEAEASQKSDRAETSVRPETEKPEETK
jgi:hypothetical protein